uniref:hypothetical protein n=1 Tax=Candidatus Ichthyocystis sparus TaxID=1561004 RepID=UPI001F5E904D
NPRRLERRAPGTPIPKCESKSLNIPAWRHSGLWTPKAASYSLNYRKALGLSLGLVIGTSHWG